MNYKYAIFDLDGTLLDSMRIWRRKEALIMQDFIGKKLDEKTLANFETMMFSTAISQAEKMCGKTFDREHYLSILHPDMKKSYESGEIKLKRNAKEFLEYLKKNGVILGVATATPRDLIVPCLKINGIYDFFDNIVTAQEVGKSKRFPDIYETAMNNLGGTKENTMFFEDAGYCIKTLVENNFLLTVIDDEMQQYEIDYIRSYYNKPIIKDYAELIKN